MRPLDPRESRAAIEGRLDAAIALHQRVRAADLAPVVEAAQAIAGAIAGGGKVLAFGNGGSAADAQHFVAELVGRFERDRTGLPAVALSADSSVVTSVANDFGYDRVFARQIEALGRRGDAALAISTSGRSPNVVSGLVAAKRRGLVTIALTGNDGGPVGEHAAIHVNVPDPSAARVQEVQRTLLHALCDIVERACEGSTHAEH